MATKYFYAINKDNIQQIDDNNSAYALNGVETLGDYFSGIPQTYESNTYEPLILDGVTLCGDTSAKNMRDVFWLCYIIPKYADELIYIYNPDDKNPAYILSGKTTGDVVYSYGCKYAPTKGEGGVETSWALKGYKIYEKVVDTTVASKTMADVIYVFGGHHIHYYYGYDESYRNNAVTERKTVADKLKILRFRPIREIKDKLNPFGLAIYNAKGELIYTVDSRGKNYQMDSYYINNTVIAGAYAAGKTPDIGSYTSKNYDNLAVMPLSFPFVSEGFAIKGHVKGMDPNRLYPIKLLKNKWSISQLSGCGVTIPESVVWGHPDSKYPIKTYTDRTVKVGNTTYYYRDILDGYYSVQTTGQLSLLTMDCSRYL